MGWGQFGLMTDDDREPKEILVEFNEGFANAEIDYQYPVDPAVYAYGYDCSADCGVTVYCSECGAKMCPVCGGKPFLIIIVQEGASAYCQEKGCRKARDKRLHEYWPTIRLNL